mmetsp:Transcript_33635/g.78683  ORF Transcript_33635/g.78683 Transcript_33635/m.78683 type:complete len:298 (-) Transcript_33635:721-1614(-)
MAAAARLDQLRHPRLHVLHVAPWQLADGLLESADRSLHWQTVLRHARRQRHAEPFHELLDRLRCWVVANVVDALGEVVPLPLSSPPRARLRRPVVARLTAQVGDEGLALAFKLGVGVCESAARRRLRGGAVARREHQEALARARPHTPRLSEDALLTAHRIAQNLQDVAACEHGGGAAAVAGEGRARTHARVFREARAAAELEPVGAVGDRRLIHVGDALIRPMVDRESNLGARRRGAARRGAHCGSVADGGARSLLELDRLGQLLSARNSSGAPDDGAAHGALCDSNRIHLRRGRR